MTPRHLALVLASLMLGQLAWAQTPKIATVDMMRAFTEVEEGRKGLKDLEKFKDDKQRMLDEKQNTLKAAKEDLDRQGMLIKPEVKQQKLEDLQRQLVETQQVFMNMQQELSKKEMEFKVSISRKLQVVIQEIAEREGYTLVLDSTMGGPVIYGRAADDITSEVIRAFNKRNVAPTAKPKKKADKAAEGQ
ncbi:MAG: OmpH family outer membrane protein [Pseudomonadota bacterium]